MKSIKKIIEACLECSIACEKCAADCLDMGLSSCVHICRDCADVCDLTARMGARDSYFFKAMTKLCEQLCERCISECSMHDHECCRRCIDACTACINACSTAMVHEVRH